MWLVILLVIVIAAVIVCFSLAAAAKNAEMISQLWLEKQRIKQEILWSVGKVNSSSSRS